LNVTDHAKPSEYSSAETDKRRDDALRRALSTPPKPKEKGDDKSRRLPESRDNDQKD